MINDLDKTIQKLLARELTDLNEANIHFEPPDDKFAPALPAVDFFLYDLRENRDLRETEWIVEQKDGLFTQTAPPVRVECSYLVTAWAGDISSEHRLLGRVIEALVRYPVLPLDLLQGDLAAGQAESQYLPLPVAALQPGRLQSVAEFWQALGGKPKAALNYSVTVAVVARPPEPAGPPVKTTKFDIKMKKE